MSRSYHDFYEHGDSARLVENSTWGEGLTALALYAIIALAIVSAWFFFWPVGQ